jgi:DNA-binding transcriptional regulator YdaS (Cro superfamily)
MLARALGVEPPTVNEWVKGGRRVPAERCPEIERLTREIAQQKGDDALVVTCEELRPDVQWGVLREAPATHADQ